MTFWEAGVGLWSTAHFLYNSGGSRGGARGGRSPIIFRPNWGPKGRTNCFGHQPPPPPPLSQVLLTAPLLSDGLDPPLYSNIATTHLCLQSLCLPCSPCSRNILRYFESQSLRLSLWASSGDETEYKLSDNLVQALAFRCLILVHLAFFAVFLFLLFFFLKVLCSCVWCAVPYPLI